MSTVPTRFRARPIVVEAIRYHPGPDGNCEAVAAFIGEDIDHEDADCDPETEWVISTLEGEATAFPGDWIVRGVRGDFYPCEADTFEANYESEDGAIIASVPDLLAAVRDVLAVADQLDRLAARHPDSETGHVETAVAHEIRAAITAHIDPTPKETDR